MPVQTFASREFTRDVAAAKRAVIEGPVFLTDRGRPAFALLNIDDHFAFTEHTAPLCAALHVPDVRAERDAPVAASAIEHGVTVVTRNAAHFVVAGRQVLDPCKHNVMD